MLKVLPFFIVLLSAVLSANYADTYSSSEAKEAIVKDFEEGKTEKYRSDNLPYFTAKQLVERGVFTAEQKLIRDTENNESTLASILSLDTCRVGEKFTASIYDIHPDSGEITCMFAEAGKLYSPVGLFRVLYPNIKKYYSIDKDKAKTETIDYVNQAIEQFRPVYDTRKEIELSVLTAGEKYLTIPQLMMAGILTDIDIIDVEATAASAKLQLHSGYTSKFTSDSSGTPDDNADYITTDTETIFDVYTGLGDLSMSMLLILIIFFAVFGIGRAVLAPLADKAENMQSQDKKIPYITGIVAGVILFFPVSDHDDIIDGGGETVGQYTIMKTKYQEFEKTGYYLFGEWADGSAKVIINAELKAIIDKSGIGTQEQIISTYAHKVQAKKLLDLYKNEYDVCSGAYDIEEMFYPNGKPIYSLTPSYIFPFSEHWAFAAKIATHTSKSYYMPADRGLVKPNGYTGAQSVPVDGQELFLYPKIALSACGKAQQRIQLYEQRYEDYTRQYEMLVGGNELDQIKINMLEGLVRFQYELYRDWGYLAILGLPVTKMQTEYIGGLYNTDSDALQKLNEQVKEDSSMGEHMIMSSIPYFFVPGAGAVYQVISENSGKIGTAVGAGLSAPAGGGIFSAITSSVGGVIGGVVGSIGGSVIGLFVAYNVAKTILALTPIIGIVVIGIVRFIIIIIKIFSFHFVSLFLMPIVFARENIRGITDFSMKVFTTMLELPLFVLSIWLAVTANSLIHNIGDFFGKRIIIGMLENNELQHQNVSLFEQSYVNGEWLSKLKIYLFDGFIELSISIFALVIIYKLIITLHNMVLDAISLRGSEALDNAVESMKNEASGWGSRI